MSAVRNNSGFIIMVSVVAVISGCASAPEKSTTSLPEWVTAPNVEDGFTDTQCVESNAAMSTLKSKATALARAEIVKQIDIQVKAMDKTYAGLTEAEEGSSAGTTFESVSKQVASQNISGSRATRTEYVDFPDGTQQLCVQVILDPELTKDMYSNITGQSGRKLSAQDDAILWQQFMAHKAQQEMDAELSKQQ
jgi:hypothetical protein